MIEGSWSNYPEEELKLAWLNVTLADHGIGEEKTPYSMPCRGATENNKSRPYTPFLCSLVRSNSPKHADQIYAMKYAAARAAAERLLLEAQQWLANAVPTDGNNQIDSWQLVVFNQLSWTRSDVVAVPVPSRLRGKHLMVTDSKGVTAASQTSAATKELIFVATDVPSMGYASFTVRPTADDRHWGQQKSRREFNFPAVGQKWNQPYENKFYMIVPGRGGLSQVVDKITGAELFDTRKLMAGEWMSLAYTGTGASETHAYRHAGIRLEKGDTVRAVTFSFLCNYSRNAGL
eukprot:SAG31_NODE_702_length_12723_cov_4.100206_2_plen_290_part_00